MANVQDRNPEPAPLGEGKAPLILILGLVGVALIAVGLWFTFTRWDVITGGLEQWHKNWYWLILCELLLFGGLAVMFLGLQIGRAEERTNPGMRRLLYGYNAVLSCLLVLTILAHVNVFVYLPVWPFTYAHETYDWSGSRLYSLSPESQELLASLDKRTKIYVLMSTNDESLQDMRDLLAKFREVNPKIEVEELSPDQSPQAVDELAKKYQLPERQGVLVVYGPEGDDKFDFVTMSDLRTENFGGQFGRSPQNEKEFKGESALIKTLNFLSEGKTRPVLYFTQGNGELELNDFDAGAPDRGLGSLKDRLGRANYEVKDLKLGGGGQDKVPEDAGIVVIARPTSTLPEAALKALREYLHPADPKAKKGKLIVLFDVVKTRDGQMVHTGLEQLVRDELGVQVDDDRVVAARSMLTGGLNRNPLEVPATGNPRTTNPVIARFQGVLISFSDVRTVDDATKRNPQAPPTGGHHVEPLFLVPSVQAFAWKETNLNRDVVAEVKDLARPENQQKLSDLVSREPLPVAVAVTDMGAGDPNDPHAFLKQQQGQQPRAVVFGDATWVSNARMGEEGLFDLFTSAVSWLRERPTLSKVTTESKTRKGYALRPENPGEFLATVLFVPLTLLVVGIIGLGAGVWVVRRR